MKFKWLDSFELGIREIDDDHIELLSIIRTIDVARKGGDLEQSTVLLDRLIQFVTVHFEREENFLDEIDYPSADLHKEYHAGILQRAHAVKDACDRAISKSVFDDCCEAMFVLLIDDVITGDLKFKSYLQEIGVAPKPLSVRR